MIYWNIAKEEEVEKYGDLDKNALRAGLLKFPEALLITSVLYR
jgi:hypothetical protein